MVGEITTATRIEVLGVDDQDLYTIVITTYIYHLVRWVTAPGHRGMRTIITLRFEGQPPPLHPVRPAEPCGVTSVRGSWRLL